MFKRSYVIRAALFLGAACGVAPASATVQFVGKVDLLEIWASGNVAFTIAPPSTTFCNGQFVVNAALPGAKNILATLLTAKSQGRQVKVASQVDSAGCIQADGYGGSYIKPDYVYLLD